MNNELKIKQKKRTTSQVLKSKALNKAKMLVRKMNNGTVTDADLAEAVELLRIINDGPKAGTAGYAALERLRDVVQEKVQPNRQKTEPDSPFYMN